jgi:hypothetical protein
MAEKNPVFRLRGISVAWRDLESTHQCFQITYWLSGTGHGFSVIFFAIPVLRLWGGSFHAWSLPPENTAIKSRGKKKQDTDSRMATSLLSHLKTSHTWQVKPEFQWTLLLAANPERVVFLVLPEIYTSSKAITMLTWQPMFLHLVEYPATDQQKM